MLLCTAHNRSSTKIRLYLLTYSQSDTEKFPTRQSFGEEAGNAPVFSRALHDSFYTHIIIVLLLWLLSILSILQTIASFLITLYHMETNHIQLLYHTSPHFTNKALKMYLDIMLLINIFGEVW